MADSRDKMVASAAALIGAHGMSATSFNEVVAASGAPRGSIYHHFPAGKEQLAGEAMAWTTERIVAHIAAGPTTTPVEVIDWFVDLFRLVAEASQGAAGCAVAGVALDNDAGTGLVEEAGRAFAEWTSTLAGQLRAAGLPEAEAAGTALTAVAAMEGALILSRADGGAGPVVSVGTALRRLVPRARPG